MLVIRIKSGLGNQMFQYALYIALKEKGKKVILDTSNIYEKMKSMKRNTIFDVFSLDHDYVINNETYNYLKHYFFAVFKKCVNRYKEVSFGNYDKNIWELNNAYLDGFWQSEKYFALYREKIREAFATKQSVDMNTGLGKIIQSETNCTVSIHIRLGDYTLENNEKLYGNICNAEYYRKAINHIKGVCSNPLFIVFSNDIHNAKELITDKNVIFADSRTEKDGWIDMCMMSKCKHHIIANSTFSWWAAWLNTNKDKIVIAPQKWLNNTKTPDICPSSWVLL